MAEAEQEWKHRQRAPQTLLHKLPREACARLQLPLLLRGCAVPECALWCGAYC